MRRILPAALLISAAFWMAGAQLALAQEQNQQAQSSPPSDSQSQTPEDQLPPAPQPEKQKPPAKPKGDPNAPNSPGAPAPAASSSGDSASPPAPEAPPAKDENPFPESVSRDAAQSAPDAPAASPAKTPDSVANPFPEDVSRRAAQDSGNSSAKGGDGATEDGAKGDGQQNDQLPPGVSSSRSSHEKDENMGDSLPGVNAGGDVNKPLAVPDPSRAKKDSQVGAFYFQTGNYRGAYLRYKDALTYDPSDIDAVFGLAEAARELKLSAEAERNYKLYLEVVPDGSKAREAEKALRSLETER